MLAKLFLALALTSAATAALPQGGISAEGAQHMQAGVDAHKQGHFDVAAEEFRKATQTDPNFPQAYLDLGQVLLETRAYDQAVAALNRALELDPESAPAHLQLGFAFLAQGYADQAIPHLQKAKSVGALGIAFIAVGRYQEAIANLSAALAQRPGDPDVLYYLARASGLLSKQSSDQLMATHADSARAHQSMGENYYVLRQMPQAEKELDSAIKQRPDLPGLHLELGLVYAGSSQWPKAEEAFRAEATLQPGNAEAAYRLGTALLQEGKHHELASNSNAPTSSNPICPKLSTLSAKPPPLKASPAKPSPKNPGPASSPSKKTPPSQPKPTLAWPPSTANKANPPKPNKKPKPSKNSKAPSLSPAWNDRIFVK